ncbi:MAG: FAD:protein FMN transferase [Pseudolysinimonas sp.]
MTRQVFSAMGTVVSLDAEGLDGATLGVIHQLFVDADRRFSLYRDDSELSRINAGTTALLDADTAVQQAYRLATEWRSLTDGAFTPTRPDGALDLNGVVKAMTMRDAATALELAGCHDWTLVVGGDMIAAGAGPTGTSWTTGIVDPFDRTTLLCAIELRGSRRAVATSGSAERGDHIWKATGPSPFVQVTVVADDIVAADVLATAIVAGGPSMLDRACDRWDVDVLTIDEAAELRATPGFRNSLAEGLAVG